MGEQAAVVVESNEALVFVRSDRADVGHQPIERDINADCTALEGSRQCHSDLRGGCEDIRVVADHLLRLRARVAIPIAAAGVIAGDLIVQRPDLSAAGVEELPGFPASAIVGPDVLNSETGGRGRTEPVDEELLGIGDRQELKVVSVFVTGVDG